MPTQCDVCGGSGSVRDPRFGAGGGIPAELESCPACGAKASIPILERLSKEVPDPDMERICTMCGNVDANYGFENGLCPRCVELRNARRELALLRDVARTTRQLLVDLVSTDNYGNHNVANIERSRKEVRRALQAVADAALEKED